MNNSTEKNGFLFEIISTLAIISSTILYNFGYTKAAIFMIFMRCIKSYLIYGDNIGEESNLSLYRRILRESDIIIFLISIGLYCNHWLLQIYFYSVPIHLIINIFIPNFFLNQQYKNTKTYQITKFFYPIFLSALLISSDKMFILFLIYETLAFPICYMHWDEIIINRLIKINITIRYIALIIYTLMILITLIIYIIALVTLISMKTKDTKFVVLLKNILLTGIFIAYTLYSLISLYKTIEKEEQTINNEEKIQIEKIKLSSVIYPKLYLLGYDQFLIFYETYFYYVYANYVYDNTSFIKNLINRIDNFWIRTLKKLTEKSLLLNAPMATVYAISSALIFIILFIPRIIFLIIWLFIELFNICLLPGITFYLLKSYNITQLALIPMVILYIYYLEKIYMIQAYLHKYFMPVLTFFNMKYKKTESVRADKAIIFQEYQESLLSPIRLRLFLIRFKYEIKYMIKTLNSKRTVKCLIIILKLIVALTLVYYFI